MRALLLAPLLLVLSGCVTSRYVASDATLAGYRYCVVPQATGHGWADITESTWRPLFEVIPENDPRLNDSATKAQTVIAVSDAEHGVWHCTGRTELRAYASNAQLLLVNTSRGLLYFGARAAVREALDEATSARRRAVQQQRPAPADDPGAM